MSISGALSNAISGLNANSRMADIVSTNVANVLTEGYAPREVALQSQKNGRGVSVVGITRQVDTALLGDLRRADGGLAGAETRAAFASEIERAIGTPGRPGGLADRLTALETSLVTAAARPEEDARLQTVIRDAGALARSLNEASDRIQTLRGRADAEIARSIENLNADLQNVVKLNKQITAAISNGRDSSGLEDQRQRVVDQIATRVPVQQLPRDNGQIALVSTGGALLLDGRAATLDYDASPIVTARMTVGTDASDLSKIRIDGAGVHADANGPLAGGNLAALLDNRDRSAVDAQASIDTIARDLIDRVSATDLASPIDGTGLFIDANVPPDSPDVGLAGRIRLNAAVDPDQGGAAFRIRDGLGAATPGPGGNAELLQKLSDALSAPREIAPGLGNRSSSDHVAAVTSAIARERLSADEQVSFKTSQATELRSQQLENGVDTDAEMQRLLLVEQAFSANARMIKTVDDMIQTLLRI